MGNRRLPRGGRMPFSRMSLATVRFEMRTPRAFNSAWIRGVPSHLLLCLKISRISDPSLPRRAGAVTPQRASGQGSPPPLRATRMPQDRRLTVTLTRPPVKPPGSESSADRLVTELQRSPAHQPLT